MGKNTTFRCWLIANFEIVLFWFTVIIGSLLLFITDREKFLNLSDTRQNDLISAHFVSIVILAIFNVPTKRAAFQYGKFLVMIGVVVIIMLNMTQMDFSSYESELMNRLVAWFWIIFSIASIIGGWLAYYTYNNMGEVLSRRMLYRNSNVSLFEFTWKYTLDRFCNITVSIVTCIGWILAIFLIYEEAFLNKSPI